MNHLSYEQLVENETIENKGVRLAESSAAWMYTRHFGLNEAPFTLTPDTRFFYAHESSQIALNTLMVAIRDGEGFTKVIGEVGTGKTLLCRTLMSELGDTYLVTYIPNPYLEPMTLLLAIADELGVYYPANVNQHQLIKSLYLFLINAYTIYRCAVVVCLDEAHAMPAETLEVLRLLSNFETEKRKLIQLVLFGQPELNKCLKRTSIRQLKQRISFSCTLKPMNQATVKKYIEHRLRVAGYTGKKLFLDEAVKYIHRKSGGVPRLVNILSHKSMMAAFGKGDKLISIQHVKLAVADTESVQTIAGVKWTRLHKTLFHAVAATLVSAGVMLYRH